MGKIFHIHAIVIGLLLVWSYSLRSEVLKGSVIDSESQLPVAYCSVIIREIAVGGMTLQDGTFRLSRLEPGLYVIEAYRTSMDCTFMAEVRIKEDEDTHLDIELEYCGISKILNTTLIDEQLCDVHNVEMYLDTVYVGHHYKPLNGKDYEEYSQAEESQFPNAYPWFFYGEREGDQIYLEPDWRYARVFRCSECIKARRVWLDNNGHIESKLPY
jgi:hypothetical protein